MEFLECKVCNIAYDEEERRPRNAPCGHEWCSFCIGELIEDSVFICPNCRQKSKVDVPDDLPVNFGLINAIRAFKSQNISLPQNAELKISALSNDDVCKVHHNEIRDRCLKCKRWLCYVCINSHTKITGCSTISSPAAVKRMKDEHTKDIDELLSNFEKGFNGLLISIQDYEVKIEENTQKMKELKQRSEEHGNEIKKIQSLLEKGKQQTGEVAKSKKHLSATNSPFAVMDGIEVLEEMKQALLSWSITHLGTDFTHGSVPYEISKALAENKVAYTEMVIKDQKQYGKLSQHEDNIYLHTLQDQTVQPGSILMPFAHLQKLISPSSTLVFMELSLGGVVKGYVHLRLQKDLPNIREHMVQLVTGQRGHTLAGIQLDRKDDGSIKNLNLPFQDMMVHTDSNATHMGKRGNVVGYYGIGYLQFIYFQVAPVNTKMYRVIGWIESGMDIVQECYNNHSQGVETTDCGLVIEKK